MDLTITKEQLNEIFINSNNKNKYAFIVGKNKRGYVFSNLQKSPHMLVASSVGKGNSLFIHTFLCSLLQYNSTKDLQVLLIDPFRIEFNIYKNCPHVVGKRVFSKSDEVLYVLEATKTEMERRFELFVKKHVKNIEEYNKTSNTKLPRIVVAVEHLHYFVDSTDTSKKIFKIIKEFLYLARAAGIHIVLSTTRLVSNVIDKEIINNTPTIICYGTKQKQDSILVLGKAGAEKLEVREFFYKNDIHYKYIQKFSFPYISDEDIVEMAKSVK